MLIVQPPDPCSALGRAPAPLTGVWSSIHARQEGESSSPATGCTRGEIDAAAGGSEDARLAALLDRLAPGARAELAVDHPGVGLDRIRRKLQLVADLTEGERPPQ